MGSLEVIRDKFDPQIFPVGAVERLQQAGVNGRIFHPWLWGGYLAFTWPKRQIAHVDPLLFTRQVIDSYTKIGSLHPGWREEMTRWGINLAVLRPQTMLARTLTDEPDWSVWYRDETAVVFRHSESKHVAVGQFPKKNSSASRILI